MEINNENIVQAVVIMDIFNKNFDPICNNKPMAFLSVAGVALIDNVLESLALGGVGETILFCCQDGSKVKEHLRKCSQMKATWSLTMEVNVLTSETCQTMGDVMREIYETGLIRGYFVLMNVNSITNINFASLLEEHKIESRAFKITEFLKYSVVILYIIKAFAEDFRNSCRNNCFYRQISKKDKGAAMTLVYKKVSWEHPLINWDKPIFLAADGNTKKILIHEKYRPKSKDKTINLPLEVILSHSEVKLHHNLADANIALCSPSVLSLFCDNFDFQTRDDFIHGILINEEILASSLYYVLLKDHQYAATVSNWKTYQVICRDILYNWVYPLSIESGSFYQNNYVSTGNHIFRDTSSILSRSCTLFEDVLIGSDTHIGDNTEVTKSMIGKRCKIGKNVKICGSHIMDNVVINDNCNISNSFIDENCIIERNSKVENGTIIASEVTIKTGTQLNGNIINSETDKGNEKTLHKSTSEGEWENDSSAAGVDEFIGFEKSWSDSESCYSSDSSAESSLPDSPVPEDTNIFLQEVIDSLARGYDEKLKCDFLILEINSSRYAYNIQLHEVNFFVVRALLSLPVLTESKNVLSIVKNILKFFRPVLSNYIKTKSSIMDCLKAIEDSCIKCEWLDGKAGQIVHLFYEDDVVDEDSLLEWREDLKENGSPIFNQTSILKFFKWLQEASEESDSD